MHFLTESEQKKCSVGYKPEDLKQAYKLLKTTLGYAPEDRFAKNEVESLAHDLSVWKVKIIPIETVLRRTHQYFWNIRNRIDSDFSDDHELLENDLDLDFAQRVKPLLDKEGTQCSSVNYLTVNLEYKEAVHSKLCNMLGFVPKKRLSRGWENDARNMIKRHALGEIKEESVTEFFELIVRLIKKNTYKKIPEQAHLIKVKDIEGLEWNEPDRKPKFKVIENTENEKS